MDERPRGCRPNDHWLRGAPAKAYWRQARNILCLNCLVREQPRPRTVAFHDPAFRLHLKPHIFGRSVTAEGRGDEQNRCD